MDDCCRLVLPYHAAKHATDGTDPCDPPRNGGAKGTTTTNHPVPHHCREVRAPQLKCMWTIIRSCASICNIEVEANFKKDSKTFN